VKEALACNLSVVSVIVGDVVERLQGVEGCEIVPDHTPEAIAAAMERTLRRGRRIEGRRAVKHLDEKVLADKLIGIYRSVLASAQARQRASASRSGATSTNHA
jgi:glycosyltransferase involved in cell wall biosynthesis